MPATYEPIASQTLGSNATFVEFTSIPGTFTDLILIVQGNTTNATTGATNILAQFNSDTASNYSATLVYGNGTSALSTRVSSQTSLLMADIARANSTGIKPSIAIAHIMSYANTNVFKTLLSSTSADVFVERTVGLWRSTSAITSVKLFPGIETFASGGTFSLFGVRAA